MTIQSEDLIAKGYEISPIYGPVKELGKVMICVGYFPRNAPCVSVRFADLPGTVITNADSLEDIEHLERLLGNAFIDHDYFEEVDEETWEQMNQEGGAE